MPFGHTSSRSSSKQSFGAQQRLYKNSRHKKLLIAALGGALLFFLLNMRLWFLNPLLSGETEISQIPVVNPFDSLLRLHGHNTDRYAEIPKFAQFNAERIGSAVDRYLKIGEENFENLEAHADILTMRELIDGLVNLDDQIQIQQRAITHINMVKADDSIRDVVGEANSKIAQFRLNVAQSTKIYDALLRVLPDCQEDADCRFLELAIKSAQLSGIGLPPESAQSFTEMQMELVILATKYSNNTIDATARWMKVIHDRELLNGIPSNYLEAFSEKAIREGYGNATAENGPWVLSLDSNSYMPVLDYADNRQLREEIFRAKIAVAGPDYGDSSNVDVINKILQLETESAEILGFRNPAEVSLASKMATLETAMGLLESLLTQSFDTSRDEFFQLQEFATQQGLEGDLKHWDIAYWSEKMKSDLYSYNQEDIKPYFHLDNVFEGLFSLIDRLFNIQVDILEAPQDSLWDSDVRMYGFKKNGVTQAYCFIDPISRPGQKANGAWLTPLVGRNRLANDRLPVAIIVLNNDPPTASRPTLLSWIQVQSIFHEMGHALQHMLTKIDQAGVAGIEGIEHDVVELPSQFMENWLFQYDVISTFAKHYQTQEVLPRELFSKVEKSKNYRAASKLMGQIRLGLVDMKLHSEFDARTSEITPFDLWRDVYSRTSVLEPLDNDYFLCDFNHIFASGYGAGYYSYLWSEVMSADAFAAFEEIGLKNEQEIKKMGLKFLYTILGLGGSKSPDEVYRLYRGRDATIDALLKHKLGIEKETLKP